MLWKVCAQVETSVTDERGQTWTGSVGLPVFYVDALYPMEAGQIAVRVITEGRTLTGPAHYTMCHADGGDPVHSGHILREEDEVPMGTGAIFRLVPERVVPLV